MRTFTTDDFTVRAFDTPVWSQERNLLFVDITEDLYHTADAKFVLTCGDYEAEYLASNFKLTINVSDIVRMMPSGTIEVSGYTLGTTPTTVEIPFTNTGLLISPKHQIIPLPADNGLISAIGGTNGGSNILFPSMILAPIDGFLYRHRAELYIDTSGQSRYLYFNYGTGANEIAIGQPVSAFSNSRRESPPFPTYLDVTTAEYPYNTNDIVLRIPIKNKELECDKRYACVQWKSRTGVIKRATWEVAKVTDNVADTVEMLRYDNAYDVRKGQEVELQLVLNGLDNYDFWYYSDIVTSSDVRVAMSNADWDSEADEIAAENKVAVTDKKVQQIDGNAGKFNKLAVTIKYKRYDTI